MCTPGTHHTTGRNGLTVVLAFQKAPLHGHSGCVPHIPLHCTLRVPVSTALQLPSHPYGSGSLTKVRFFFAFGNLAVSSCLSQSQHHHGSTPQPHHLRGQNHAPELVCGATSIKPTLSKHFSMWMPAASSFFATPCKAHYNVTSNVCSSVISSQDTYTTVDTGTTSEKPCPPSEVDRQET